MPNNYRRNNKVMNPAYLKGYPHFMYANLDETIIDSDFNEWVLSLFDNNGVEVAPSIGTIVKDIITGSEYRFYSQFTIPENVNNGIYQLVVYNSSSSELKYVSNCVQVISSDQVESYALLFFRNSTNTYNFNYEAVSDYNTIFLPWNVIEQQPEIEIKQYFEQSTGKTRNQKKRSTKVVTIEAFFFDDEANDMMAAISGHDDLLINGTEYVVKTGYKIETNKLNSLQKGTIEFYDQEYNQVNLNG